MSVKNSHSETFIQCRHLHASYRNTPKGRQQSWARPCSLNVEMCSCNTQVMILYVICTFPIAHHTLAMRRTVARKINEGSLYEQL